MASVSLLTEISVKEDNLYPWVQLTALSNRRLPSFQNDSDGQPNSTQHLIKSAVKLQCEANRPFMTATVSSVADGTKGI